MATSATATCCSALAALAWIDLITESAIAGDEDYRRLLPNVLEHYLVAARRERLP